MKSPSRVFVGAFMGSLNQPGFSLTLLNLTHVAKSTSSVDQVISLIDAPHASASWPTNSIIGSTPEALRNRTREERLERSSPIVLSSIRHAYRRLCSPATPPSSTRSTHLLLTSVVLAEVRDPATWRELPFINSLISRRPRWPIKTSIVCSVGWRWAWWHAPSF